MSSAAASRNRPIFLLAAALKAWDRQQALQDADNAREQRRRQTDHDYILKPPAPRGYGYATPDDLAKLGYDPVEDRRVDLERWRHDLELAVDAGLITQQEGEEAWRSATKVPRSSTSSTGTSSTTAPTPMTKPSSTASPTAAAGPPSRPPRKQANRRSSSPWQFRPPSKDTK